MSFLIYQSQGLRIFKGDTATVQNYIGLEGELSVNTETKAVYVHDGLTPGGTPLTTAEQVELLGMTLGQLANVELDTPSDGQVLVYDEDAGVWKNELVAGAGGGAVDLDGLNDVDLVNPADNQVLTYNQGLSKWENKEAPAAGIDGITSMDGNIGVGTSSPSNPSGTSLTVFDTSIPRINLKNSTTGDTSTAGGEIRQSGNQFLLTNRQNSDLIFGTNNTERMRIDSSGKVGIGEETPLSKVHIKNTSANDGIRIVSSTTGEGYVIFGDTADPNTGSIAYNHSSDAMTFDVNNAERMRIDSSGKVGIGTTSPYTDLYVKGSFFAGDSGDPSWRSHKSTGVTIGGFASGANPTNAWNSDRLTWKFSNNNNCLTVAVGGAVNDRKANIQVGHSSVGTYSAHYGSLYLNKLGGAVYANTTSISDLRKKRDVEQITDAISKIQKLSGYTFNLIDVDPEKRQAGLIAQEVLEVLPEAVTYEESEDFYGVSYHMLSSLYVEAIKEQQVTIESQQTMIESQQATINDLVSRLSTLEAKVG